MLPVDQGAREDQSGPRVLARVVVAVAVVERGRVLAARRTTPPELAGGWELPGGKVATGETPEAAAVREVEEELGCRVEVTGWLRAETTLRPGLVLRGATARLVDGDPVPREHDALWWVDLDRDRPGWLDADRPLVEELMALLAVEDGGRR